MSGTKKLMIGAGIVVVLGGLAYANFAFRRTTGIQVNVEKIGRHDLEAIVSASGKIQPKKSVQISAETVGKVVNLQVKEGDMVKAGQPLLQIDPRTLETQVRNREASLSTATSTLDQTRSQVESARVALKQAQDDLKRQEGLWNGGLTTRDAYERAGNNVKTMESNLQLAEQSVKTQEERIKAEQATVDSARYDLTKLRILAPIDGLVTRRNIEEGETVMMGTMNNAGTVLLTIADMSVIEAEVEVDETDIPFVAIGQPAKVTIDALADKTFNGKVTEVGNSPIQATGTASTTTTRATNFKVVVTIDGTVPDVRPGFTTTAVITTATRQNAISVPIQATTVREMTVDEEGNVVHPEPTRGGGPAKAPVVTAPVDLKPGQARKELEGVFVFRDNRAVFTPIRTGIAGEKYFEVLGGLAEGDQVITGPFASVRSLKDGDVVKITTAPVAAPGAAK
jgi:HlyD family secretion protein